MTVTVPAPIVRSAAVTPADGADNCVSCKSLHNGSATAGVVKVMYVGQPDSVVGTLRINAGGTISGSFRRVLSTGTTVGTIEALY